MKSFYIVLFSSFFIFSCNDGNKKSNYRDKSVGNINSLQVIITDELWADTVGEEIRTYFTTPQDGLPQDEPIYSINQMEPSTFSGFIRTNRIFLHATIGTEESIKLSKDPFARPQVGAVLMSKTKEGLVKLILENHQRILKAFHTSEIKERQRRTKLSLLKIDSLKERFGMSLQLSSAYRIAHKSDNFYWLRKNLRKSGSTNIIIYEAPLDAITNDSLALTEILKIRDSIGGPLITVEDEGQFRTDNSYAPNLYKTELDGKFAYMVKGIWDVKGEFMAGPFINYAVRDEKNNRYLIIEGFTYAPQVRKRNLQFELESIIESSKIK